MQFNYNFNIHKTYFTVHLYSGSISENFKQYHTKRPYKDIKMNITTITNNKALKAIGNEPFKFLSIKDIRDCRKSNIQKTETLVVKSLCCDILTCFFYNI